ncbi:MAG: hypothetical protein DWH81_07875 [Planctomycetota bacterium]|nr:MAG: hypothetical protein DWH81_07875 [Planctomycetota bacterium]
MPFFYPSGLSNLLMPFTLANVVLHILVAIGVYNDSTDRVAAGRKLWFVGVQVWTFATLLGGITTAAIYWMIHHSMLARPEPSSLDIQ